MDRYAVFGNPIAHSLSPKIHTAFAKQFGEDITYSKVLVAEGQFAITADEFFASGGLGLNITVPFKEEAYRYAHQLSDRAKLAGAVNTLIKQQDQQILGDNTDGVGLVVDITQRLGWVIANKRLLVLGAGGAVRGVLQPLLARGPREIVIANRTLAKAETLAQQFGSYGVVSPCHYEQVNGVFEVIINATSAGLDGRLPPLSNGWLGPHTACYDMVYQRQQLTPFLQWAQAQGISMLADGLGMLLAQAAESFRLWRGHKPDILPLMNSLQSESSD